MTQKSTIFFNLFFVTFLMYTDNIIIGMDITKLQTILAIKIG